MVYDGYGSGCATCRGDTAIPVVPNGYGYVLSSRSCALRNMHRPEGRWFVNEASGTPVPVAVVLKGSVVRSMTENSLKAE